MIWIDFCSSPHQCLMTIHLPPTHSDFPGLPSAPHSHLWVWNVLHRQICSRCCPFRTAWSNLVEGERRMWTQFDQELQKVGIKSWLRWSGWGQSEQVNGGKRRKGVQTDAGSKVENRSERAGWWLGTQSLLRLWNQTEADFRNSFHSTEMCKSAAKNRKKWG